MWPLPICLEGRAAVSTATTARAGRLKWPVVRADERGVGGGSGARYKSNYMITISR